MKIFYGVQGTGNGHITRARVMAKALAADNDIQVDYLFSGRAAHKYFDMQCFGDYQTRQGLTFHTSQGHIQQFKTLRHLRPLQFINDVKKLDLSGYDLVLNDFEPVSAWAARRQGIPSISISHQAAFSHAVPKQGDTRFNRLLLKYFAPCQINLGVHWHHFGFNLLPPLIDTTTPPKRIGEHYLVYLPFESLADIQELLHTISEHQFVCYHPDISEDRADHNITWRRPSSEGFHQTLLSSAGVIANGGFELASECLSLGKKILIKPLQGQFEQLSNVLTLEQLNLCSSMDRLSTTRLEKWIATHSNNQIRFPTDANVLVAWLKTRRWDDSTELCRTLWEQVVYPEEVQRQLNRYPKLV